MFIVDYLLIIAFFVLLAILLFFVATSTNMLAHEEGMKARLLSAREAVKERGKSIPTERVVSYLALLGLFGFFIVTAWLSHRDEGGSHIRRRDG